MKDRKLYSRIIGHEKYQGIASPEMLKGLEQRDRHLTYDIEKATVWAFGIQFLTLGITIISALSAVDFLHFYNMGMFQVLYKNLQESIELLADLKYSKEIMHILQLALCPKPENRPTIERLFQLIVSSNKVPIHNEEKTRVPVNSNSLRMSSMQKNPQNQSVKLSNYTPGVDELKYFEDDDRVFKRNSRGSRYTTSRIYNNENSRMDDRNSFLNQNRSGLQFNNQY